MGGAVLPPSYLTWDQTLVEVRKILVTFKRPCAGTAVLGAPDPAASHRQPTLCLRLLDPTGESQSVLWGHCSFLLGPGAHKILSVPCKSLFPQSYVRSIIRSHWPPKSNSLGFSISLPDPQVGKSIVGPRTFLTVWELLLYSCSSFVGRLLGTWMVGLIVTSSKRTFATDLRDPDLLHPELHRDSNLCFSQSL